MLEKDKKLFPQYFMQNSQRNGFLLINVLCFARLNEFVYFKPTHFSGSVWQTSGEKIYLKFIKIWYYHYFRMCTYDFYSESNKNEELSFLNFTDVKLLVQRESISAIYQYNSLLNITICWNMLRSRIIIHIVFFFFLGGGSICF